MLIEEDDAGERFFNQTAFGEQGVQFIPHPAHNKRNKIPRIMLAGPRTPETWPPGIT
jgi:hypothetical protein